MGKKELVALTGAGVSKQSGIPTFAEMGSLREKLSRTYFERYPKEFFELLVSMKVTCDAAEPNEAHTAIARFKVPVITMNIDGLHSRAGSADTIEIHGNLRDIHCTRCNKKYSYEVLSAGIKCPACGGGLNPDIVLYGDMIPRLHEALTLAGSAKRLLIVGTSFYTSTASYVADAAKAAGAQVDIINEDAAAKVPEYLEALLGKEGRER